MQDRLEDLLKIVVYLLIIALVVWAIVAVAAQIIKLF